MTRREGLGKAHAKASPATRPADVAGLGKLRFLQCTLPSWQQQQQQTS
jgi:hypothetical protein